MTNFNLINEAVKLVIEFFEAEGIEETTATIQKRATNWYNKTEITDKKMLAAATISGEYTCGTSWADLIEITEFYFPTVPVLETIQNIDEILIEQMIEDYNRDDLFIGEIESSQKDCLWW